MDAMLFFLFVMQPGLTAVPAPGTYVLGGLACLGGIGVAILSFRFLLPVDPERRLKSLLLAIARDLLTIAATDSAHSAEKSRFRVHHRVLRLLTNASKIDNDASSVVEGGLAALAIGRCLQQLRDCDRDGNIASFTAGYRLEAARKLSEAVQRQSEILPVLETLSAKLCHAVAPLCEVCSKSVETTGYVMQRERLLPTRQWLVEEDEYPCLT